MKFEEWATNGVMLPMNGLWSPKYVRRYVPAAARAGSVPGGEGAGIERLTGRAVLDDPGDVDAARAGDLCAGAVSEEVWEMQNGPRTVLSRFHWNVVDGCESERTGFHWPPANWSTVRNVCSRRRLFYRSRQ